MAYSPSAIAPRNLALPEKSPRVGRSALRWLLDAIQQSNMRRAEREIERYLRGAGSKFTDETEHEIERRILSSH